MAYYTYILASKKDGVLYIGVTSNLKRRIWEHKNKILQGFSSKYWCHRLVYYEEYDNVNEAIYREKRLKKWKRDWKIKLIEKINPNWSDLHD
ncbi:MAG: GIY-YIG nuclease family protein [Patescibacteria group bacterium]